MHVEDMDKQHCFVVLMHGSNLVDCIGIALRKCLQMYLTQPIILNLI